MLLIQSFSSYCSYQLWEKKIFWAQLVVKLNTLFLFYGRSLFLWNPSDLHEYFPTVLLLLLTKHFGIVTNEKKSLTAEQSQRPFLPFQNRNDFSNVIGTI